MLTRDLFAIEYLRTVDSRLFNSIQSPSHCLSHLLPTEKQHFGLRTRGHCYALLYAKITFVNDPLLRYDTIRYDTVDLRALKS